MKSTLSIITCTLFGLLLFTDGGSANEPHQSVITNDDSDEMLLEQAEQTLAAALTRAIADLASRTVDKARVDSAQSLLLEAQRQWISYRDAECVASIEANVLSARTRKGLMAVCLREMTEERVARVTTY